MKNNTKISPWVTILVMGVVAILFAVFGFQQQTEAMAAREELNLLRSQVIEIERKAADQQAEAIGLAMRARDQEAKLAAQLAECLRIKQK
ncbi:MAG: hypothetical protein SH819_05740 [Cytophagales bacterium]|nr:hypothetical protein [Cytophagales bacterium]